MKPGDRIHAPDTDGVAASCRISICNALPKRMRQQTRELSRLLTPRSCRRQGYATELLKKVCDEADEVGITLVLFPHPFGDMALGRSQLIDWYGRFGFVLLPQEPPMMARSPGSIQVTRTVIAEACSG